MSAPADLAAAPRPDVRVGDLWRFAVHDRLRGTRAEETRRVVAVDEARIVCENASTDRGHPRGRYEYTRDWNLLSRPALGAPGDAPEDIGRWTWVPHYPHFRFPLVAGARWHGEARVSNPATATTNVHRYEAQVEAPLELAVPAGRFRVWPVRYTAQVATVDDELDRRWRNEETLAWSPAARLFVRAEHRIVGPDGRPTRDSVAELLEARRAA